MNSKKMQELFDNNNYIKFKLYSMNYIIQQKNDFIEAFAEDFPGRKEKYKSFKETMNNFKIYNEPLINQIDNIELIENDEEYI